MVVVLPVPARISWRGLGVFEGEELAGYQGGGGRI